MKRSKRALLGAMTMCMSVAALGAFAGCENLPAPAADHVHNWGEWEVTTPATCTADGEKTRVCNLDPAHKDTEKIDKLGHDYSDEWTVDLDATCTADGSKSHHCNSCDAKADVTVITATDHDWGDWEDLTPATCTAAKTQKRVCNHNADHTETRTVGEPLGHHWDEGVVTTPPQLGVAGEKTYTCTVDGCGATKTEPIAPLEHTHSYTGDWQKDETGHWKVCDGDDCNEISAQAAHDWDDGVVTTPATCSAAGVKTYTCETCGFVKTEPVEVDPAAHDWNDWTVTTPATCTADGVKTRTCKHDATHTETGPVPAAGHHDWSEWTIVAPTGTDTGTATRTCSGDNCDAPDELKTVVLPVLTDAGYTKTEDTATCVAAGVITYTYTFNDESISFTLTTKATGIHTVNEWTTTTEPTCKVEGAKSGYCSVCDQEITESIPATGKHTPTGLYDACAVCGTQPQSFDYTVSGNDVTINFTIKPEEWCTVRHLFRSAGYVIYTYNGTTPIQIWYSTYGNGAARSGNATLNQGDSFFIPSSNRGTGYFAMKSNSETDVTGTISGVWQTTAPVMPTALTLGTHKVNASADSDAPNTFYEFTATEEGANDYVLYCDDADAVILKKSGSDSEYSEVTLPYAFTLSQGEKISFQTLVDFECAKNSYSVTLAKGAVHEHNWGDWTEKSPADCANAKIEQRDCLDSDCPTKGHEERSVGDTLSHTLTAHPAVAATCTVNGNEAYWACDVCGKKFSDADGKNEITEPVAVPALNHDWDDWTVITPATCTADGVKTRTCKRDAAHTETAAIPATGHNLTYTKTDPTATDKGSITAACSSGDLIITEDYDFNAGTVTAVANDQKYLIYVTNSKDTAASMGYGLNVTLNKGVYEFSFKYLDVNAHAISAARASLGNKRFLSNATTVQDAFKNNVKLEFENGNLVKMTVTVDGTVVADGAKLAMQLGSSLNPGETAYCVVGVKFEPAKPTPVIIEGDNTVNVTVANSAEDIDCYDFTPAETKTYSMTVPAGVFAVMNGASFIDATVSETPVSQNFDATAGVKITFTFGSANVGEYSVNIGEEKLTQIIPDTPLNNHTVAAKNVAVVQVGAVEAGKYKLQIKVGTSLMQSAIYFGKNINPDYNEIYGPADKYGLGGTAEIIYQNMQITKGEGIDYECTTSRAVFTVTLDLQEGDKLVFAHSNTVDGMVSLTLTKVA